MPNTRSTIVDHVLPVPGLRGTSTDAVWVGFSGSRAQSFLLGQLQFAGRAKPLRPPSGADAGTNFASQVAIQCSTPRPNVA